MVRNHRRQGTRLAGTGRRLSFRNREAPTVPSKNEDLHGNAPDKSEVALLLIDVINDLEFPEGGLLLEHALQMAKRIAEVKRAARSARVPVVYVNDNFGRWRSDFNAQVQHCLEDGVRGKQIVQLLK